MEEHFTEPNVIYGVESNLNIFCPRSQVVNRDCDVRCACHTQVVRPVEEARPDRRQGCMSSSLRYVKSNLKQITYWGTLCMAALSDMSRRGERGISECQWVKVDLVE